VSRTSVASTRKLRPIPAQTPATAPSPGARRRRGSVSGSRYGVVLTRADLDVADADVGLEVEHGSVRSRAGQRQLSIRVDAVVARAHEVDRADPGVGVDHDGDVLRHR
jgi:hypothetical protein